MKGEPGGVDLPHLSIEEALSRLTAGLRPVGAEAVPLERSLRRILAEDVRARHPLPPFANSSMDGYAVRAEDVASATPNAPIKLQVVGEAAAGAAALPQVAARQAARITTGAPLPPGADAVVPVEQTDRPGPMVDRELSGEVVIKASAEQGAHVRPAGQDVPAGQVVLREGHRLGPEEVGLLAAVGLAEPVVRRVPRVGIFSTGDEVVEVSADLGPGQIRDANGHMLAAFVEAAGGQARRLGIAADSKSAVRALLTEAADGEMELILTSGGVSMGAHDYVREVLVEDGELEFWKVNIRPGKPLAFGTFRGIPFLGLPGNPVSAWVTFALFVQPVLNSLLGRSQAGPVKVKARLEEAVRSDGRESFLRARLWGEGDGYRTRLTGDQDSGILSSLVLADGLLHLPGGKERAEADELVDVWLMGDDGVLWVDFSAGD